MNEVFEVPSEEEIHAHRLKWASEFGEVTGLRAWYDWSSSESLIQAKVRIMLANLHPQHKSALRAIEEAQNLIFQIEWVKFRSQREKALDLAQQYISQRMTLSQLWQDLRSIDADWRSEL